MSVGFGLCAWWVLVVEVWPLPGELLGHPHPLPPHRDGLLEALAAAVPEQPDPAPLLPTGPATGVVVQAIVDPQPPRLGRRQLLTRTDPGAWLTSTLASGTTTSWSLWKARASGTRLAVVPNRPLWTSAHTGWPVRSSRYRPGMLPMRPPSGATMVRPGQPQTVSLSAMVVRPPFGRSRAVTGKDWLAGPP